MSFSPLHHLIACHECDRLFNMDSVTGGNGVARCIRCGATLSRRHGYAIATPLALFWATLFLLMVVNFFPLLTFKIGAQARSVTLVAGVQALLRSDMGAVAMLVLVTSILAPLLHTLIMLYLLIPMHFQRRPRWGVRLFKIALALTPWAMLGVYMLAVMVAMVKLQHMATLVLEVALFALAALLPVATAANATLDIHQLWENLEPQSTPLDSPLRGNYEEVELRRHSRANGNPEFMSITARQAGLTSCPICHRLTVTSAVRHCLRCHTLLHSRKPDSLSRTWALLLTAVILYIPANLYPVMTVLRLGQGEPNTILSGVAALIHAEMWPLALVVFMASVAIPLFKIGILGYLAWSVSRGSHWQPRARTVLYRFTEAFGHWSMVDVFLVAILVALVDMGKVARITPGLGVSFFAAVVILTILAARSFDPRLIWD